LVIVLDAVWDQAGATDIAPAMAMAIAAPFILSDMEDSLQCTKNNNNPFAQQQVEDCKPGQHASGYTLGTNEPLGDFMQPVQYPV